ncbi:MAG: DUF2244 domain-containing protein [Pseudomonadales bacterium]|nr:DUF2244 domain-containing protein [Pseudomonadales bacterium]
MVNAQHKSDSSVIILRPNRSASWQQSCYFLYILGGVIGLIAVIWALAGAWLVLPFAGLEVAVLTYVMYRVSYYTAQKQVITVDKHQVVVEQGVDYPTARWVFSRPEVHVSVLEAANPIDSITLRLVEGNQQQALGTFLNQGDLQKTRHALQEAGLVVCSDRWWKKH